MRQSISYRAARRNVVRRIGTPAKGEKGFWWGNDWAHRANAHARIVERIERCKGARDAFLAAVATRFTNTPKNPYRAVLDFWKTVPGARPRERRRMVKHAELDLRAARA